MFKKKYETFSKMSHPSLLLCSLGVILVSVNSSVITTSNYEEVETTTLLPAEEQLVDFLRVLPPPEIRASLVESGKVREVFSEKAGDTLVIPLEKYDLHIGQDLPTKVVRFDCNSSVYPVEWTYEGPGAPFNIVSKTFRHITNFSDPETYTFSAFIDLTRNDELNTGKYVCKGISKKGLEFETNSYFQLYVPGDKLFLPRKLIITKLTKNSTEFVVPCSISNPEVSKFIKLYKDDGKGSKPLRVTFNASYDATIGFKVPVDSYLPLKFYKGRYFCREPLLRKFSLKHTVLPPKEEYVQVIPPTKFINLVMGVKQVFICAAKENITLTISGDRQPRIIDFEVNPNSDFPYLATLEMNPGNITSEHTIINCVTTKNEILHTWEYSTFVDVAIQKFYFDSNKRYQDARYVCCSNSFYKPKLLYTFCKSETECSFKRLMFDKDEETKEKFLGEYNDRVSPFNSSCVMFKPYLKYTLPSGMLRCSVQGVNSEVHRDFMYYFNPYRIYQAYTDDKFDTSKVAVSESIMKLSKTPSKNTLVGQTQRFLCYFSELFLANGIKWRIEYKNGSSYFLESSYDTLNSNTSFSHIELTFNDTEIIGIHCYAPVKDSPTDWRNVTGIIFVREPPKITASIQTISGEILKEININSTTGIILDNSTLHVLNNSLNSSQKLETFFVLKCVAKYPVDFTYFGDGTPQLDYLPNRVVNGSLLDANAYSYSSHLRFLQVSYQSVGTYSCVSSTREFGHRNKEENLGVNVNVFVPGERLFISSENQTFRAWEYRDAVLIPCTVADPRPNITLLRFSNDTKTFEPLDTPIPLQFDPIYGFSLTKNHTPSLYGLYKCVGDENRTSGIIQVYLPSDSIRVDPYVKEIQIFGNETLDFKCECKDNVTITFSDDKKRDVIYHQDFNSLYPYVATYNAKIGEFSNNSLTWVNCTSLNDSKYLHTWELYPGDGNFIDQLSYDNSTKEIKCCTKPFRSPAIEWINCTSVTECTIKQSACLTQNKCQASDYILTEEIDKSRMKNGCLTFNVEERPQGLLKCVVKGFHKIVAQAMVYFYNNETDYEAHDGYFLGTKMFDKFEMKNSNILKLTQTKEGSNSSNIIISSGDKVTFDCIGNKFFVSSTFKWGLEAENGTLYYMDGKVMPNYNHIHTQLEIEFETTTWKNVYCITPNWKEYFGWRNVSIPLIFEEKESTTISDGLLISS